MQRNIDVSEMQILPVKPNNGLVAFASCLLNKQFYLGNIAIYTTPNGKSFRLVYPAKVLSNGKQINTFHPITKEAGEAMSYAIINEYNKLIVKAGAEIS